MLVLSHPKKVICFQFFAKTHLPSEAFSKSIVGIVVGVVVGILFVLALVLFYYYKKMKARIDLSALPEDVRVFYEHYFKAPGSWSKEGTCGRESLFFLVT